MPITITKEDLKQQIHVNLAFAKHASGPLKVAAVQLAKLWLTQIPSDMQRDIEIAEQVRISEL